jgi:hypothetical protein
VPTELDWPGPPVQVSVAWWGPADEYVCVIGPVVPESGVEVPSPKSTLPEPPAHDASTRTWPCDVWLT